MVLEALKSRLNFRSLARGSKYVKTLTLRNLTTDTHRKHWKDWLGVLYARSYFCLLANFIFMTIEYAIGSNRAQ